MKAMSRQATGRSGDPAGSSTSKPAALRAAEDALRMSRNLPFTGAEAALATLSFAANRLFADQVRNAHAWGEFARAQSKTLLDASENMHDGPMRDALAIAARLQGTLGEGVIAAASRWGRRYGHLVFALPVPGWRR